MATAPRHTPRKRQNVAANQSVITGFFKPSTTTPTSTTTTDPPPPPLPGAVQSGLLSVGMRVRRAVPEGYKSGTYAFNKHLPSVGVNPSSDLLLSSSTPPPSLQPSKKRSLDYQDQDEGHQPPPVTVTGSITGWARTGKRTSFGGKKNRAAAPIHRGFHKAISRSNNPVVVTVAGGGGGDDFEEADFLRPVDAMEE